MGTQIPVLDSLDESHITNRGLVKIVVQPDPALKLGQKVIIDKVLYHVKGLETFCDVRRTGSHPGETCGVLVGCPIEAEWGECVHCDNPAHK